MPDPQTTLCWNCGFSKSVGVDACAKCGLWESKKHEYKKVPAQTTEFKPCPFCGMKATHTERDSNPYYPWLIHCVNGRCGVGPIARAKTEEDVIKVWNTRHDG